MTGTLAFTILKDLFWFYTNLKTYTRNLAFTILMWQQASDCRPAVVENFMWQQVSAFCSEQSSCTI
jgi:hypothetical protein